MAVQLDIFKSSENRDQGIMKAVDHANAVVPNWKDCAHQLLQEFLSVHPGPFMAEDVRAYASQIDFPLPPHARAWGGVIMRAMNAGLIIQEGTGKVKNVKAHRANAAIWREVKKSA